MKLKLFLTLLWFMVQKMNSVDSYFIFNTLKFSETTCKAHCTGIFQSFDLDHLETDWFASQPYRKRKSRVSWEGKTKSRPYTKDFSSMTKQLHNLGLLRLVLWKHLCAIILPLSVSNFQLNGLNFRESRGIFKKDWCSFFLII